MDGQEAANRPGEPPADSQEADGPMAVLGEPAGGRRADGQAGEVTTTTSASICLGTRLERHRLQDKQELKC